MKRILLLFFTVQFLIVALSSQETIRMLQIFDDSKLLKPEQLHLPYKKISAIELNTGIFDSKSCAIGDKLIIELFDDVSYEAIVDRININVNGTFSIRARFIDYPMGYMILSKTDNHVLASISLPEKNERYSIKTNVFSDHTYLKLLDLERLDYIEPGPVLIPPGYPKLDDKQLERLQKAAEKDPDEPANIDVMIVYTPNAAAWAASHEGSIDNTIAQAMAKAQLALDNSETIINMTLCNSAEVNYTESGSSYTDINRLTFHEGFNPFDADGDPEDYMEEVHDWREMYGADLVAMFAEVENVGGLGWLLNTSDGYPEFGFSLTRVQQASTSYTHIHEMGHNMGCHHHKEQSFQAGPTNWNDWPENTWSAGWRWMGDDEQMYCGVMTYNSGQYFDDGIDAIRVPYFSNPNVNYQGQPVGDAVDGDNARTLREIKHVIAAYAEAADPGYKLSLVAEPEEGGTVDGAGHYEEEEQVSVTASANVDYEFVEWSGDTDYIADHTAESTIVTMPAYDITLTASFEPEIQDAQTVTFNVTDQNENPLENVKITINPAGKQLTTVPAKRTDKSRSNKTPSDTKTHLAEQLLSFKESSNPTPASADKSTHDKGEWIHWDDGVNANSVGVGGDANLWTGAIRFEVADIQDYDGMEITEVRTYLNNLANAAAVVIWQGQEGDLTQMVYNSFTPVEEDWIDVTLEESYKIDASQELWIGVEVLDPGDDFFPLGTDAETDYDGKGNLVTLDGDEWILLTDFGVEGDWNIQAYVTTISPLELFTDVNGQASFEAESGEYEYVVEKEGYTTVEGGFAVEEDPLNIDFTLIAENETVSATIDPDIFEFEDFSDFGVMETTITWNDASGVERVYYIDGEDENDLEYNITNDDGETATLIIESDILKKDGSVSTDGFIEFDEGNDAGFTITFTNPTWYVDIWVYDELTGSGIDGALVHILETDETDVSDNGDALFKLEAGTYNVNITADGFATVENHQITVEAGNDASNYFEIGMAPLHTLTLIANPEEGGTVAGAGEYTAGTEVSIEATANEAEDWAFVNWTDQNDEFLYGGASFNYVMPEEDVTFTANFSKDEVYQVNITVEPENSGSVTGEGGYLEGDAVALEAYANEGYEFANWSDNDGEVSIDQTYVFDMPGNDVQLTANFELIAYTVSFVVEDKDGNSIESAVIELGEMTNDEGDYVFEDIEPGVYDYIISAEDYFDATGTVEVVDEDVNEEVTMHIDDTFVDEQEEVKLSVFPNPTRDKFNVESTEMIRQVRLLDISGQLVLNENIDGMHTEVNVHSLRAGIYFMQIFTAEKVVTKRVQVLR